MAFASWAYFILVASIVALNHKIGKPWDDERGEIERKKARTRERMRQAREAEKKASEEYKRKRCEARAKEKKEAERLARVRASERVWPYGPQRYYD